MQKFIKIVLSCLMLVFIVGFFNVKQAEALRNTENFQFIVGQAPVEGPDVTMAKNGDKLEVSGNGTLTLHPGSIAGGGTFTHRNAGGGVIATGTWTAEKLLHFESFGGAAGFPENFEGGVAVVRIHISPSAGGAGFSGILRITCLVGVSHDDSDLHEGVEVRVKGVRINFNEPVSGETLFIRQP